MWNCKHLQSLSDMMLRGFLHLLIIRILENVSEKNLRPPTSKIHTKCLFFESKSIHLLGDIPKKALFPGTINHHCPLYKALFRPAQLFPRWRPLRFGHDDSSSLPIPLRSTTLSSRTQRYRHLGRHLFSRKIHGIVLFYPGKNGTGRWWFNVSDLTSSPILGGCLTFSAPSWR